MLQQSLLSQLVADSAERAFPQLTPRRVDLPALPVKANVVIGMRRTGKTCLVQRELMHELERGTPRESMLFINFEDERLWEMGAEDLSGLLEEFYRRTPENRGRRCVLAFDEIQNVPGWELFVRRVLDSENARVILTGSSAKLLSLEIATSLRGRALSTELFPFDWAESLAHSGEKPPTARPSRRAQTHLEAKFDRYLQVGGFPEVQRVSEPLRRRILQDYLQVALLRDIIERHSVTSVHALRAMSRQLISNPAGLFSIQKLYADLKSRGIAVSKNTLHELLDHFEDAYLFFPMPIWTNSERVRQTNPRKIYPVDPGLVTACTARSGYGVGQLLESFVYLTLRRQSIHPAYYKDRTGTEVDFVVEGIDGISLTQVSADITAADTKKRELRALTSAMRELGVKEATIVTLRHEEELEVEEGRIHIVPAWWWALSQPSDSCV